MLPPSHNDWLLPLESWLVGMGPGAALTVRSLGVSHPFPLQQAMETGLLGLIGLMLFSVGVYVSLIRTVLHDRGDAANDTRFTLIIGPAAYVTYSLFTGAPLHDAGVNTWTVILASMLALMPAFERGVEWTRYRNPAAASAVPPRDWQRPPDILPSLAR
jgi:hypothetical protein